MVFVMITFAVCGMITVIPMMMDHVFDAMLCTAAATATATALGTTLGCCTKHIIERKSKQFHLNLYYTQI